MLESSRQLQGHIPAIALAVLLALGAIKDVTRPAQAQTSFTEQSGSLNGTPWRLRVPSNWNGVLISDLDYAGNANAERYMFWLGKGYAVSGTSRRADRTTNYDPAHEIQDLLAVIDMVASGFGKPSRIIQYGHSGGGYVGIAMAEQVPDRIDGVVAGCAHGPVWLMNTMLDGWFVAQALIAPSLKIVNLPAFNNPDLTAAWRSALTAAQQTPQGRARIALAVALGQWPHWTTGQKPDPRDAEALQESMYQTMLLASAQPGGQSRYMFEQSGLGQPSWNTGIDYADLFRNANEFHKQAVRKLYREAGLDLDADLARVNAAPRIDAAPNALAYWSVPGRTYTGKPAVPVLRIHTIGDWQVPHNVIQGYDDAVRRNGLNNMYKTALVDTVLHCTYSTAESAAAVEAVMERLDKGRWESATQPKKLNELGQSLHPSAVRYINFDLEKYNRTWFPGR